MSEADERAAVVAEALTWAGTPYRHRARLKGVGADCAQFPLAVYEAMGLIPPTDVGAYVQDWHHHRSEELYLGWVRRLAREIDETLAGPGDFAVWRFGRAFSHGAILIDPPVIIHATVLGRRVHLADYRRDDGLPGRPVKFFSLWGDHGR